MACCHAVAGCVSCAGENARTSATLYVVAKIGLARPQPPRIQTSALNKAEGLPQIRAYMHAGYQCVGQQRPVNACPGGSKPLALSRRRRQLRGADKYHEGGEGTRDATAGCRGDDDR